MSHTLLERVRVIESETSKLRDQLSDDLSRERKNTYVDAARDSRCAERLYLIAKNAQELKKIFKDEDGTRKEELETFTGRSVFTTFYKKLRTMKKFHQINETLTADELADIEPEVHGNSEWSSNEFNGRFVDMNTLYNDFINLKQFDKMTKKVNEENDKVTSVILTYHQFLSTFHRNEAVPLAGKNSKYLRFYSKALRYLAEFWTKRHPLSGAPTVLARVDADFQRLWQEERLEGYQIPRRNRIAQEPAEPAPAEKTYDPIDLAQVKTEKDLLEFGMERLKHELWRLGLKGGGTLEQRAARLFLLKDNSIDQIPKKNLRKKRKLVSDSSGPNKRARNLPSKAELPQYLPVALLEFRVNAFANLLSDVIVDTQKYLQKKQTMSYEEVAAELQEQQEEEPEPEEPEPDVLDPEGPDWKIYNPKNVPLDETGIPIPYWLFKLRGLDKYFVCEICGGYIYRGPQAFERHFSEWRHAHGMRCLGIPNTKDFHGITKINDAIALWQKIQARRGQKGWNRQDEEFEDKDGNVFKKSIYDQLRRQGVI